MKNYFSRFFKKQKPKEYSIKDWSMTPNEPYGCDIDPLRFPKRNSSTTKTSFKNKK